MQVKPVMKPKRIRVWRTSKNGCFTCKSRHIKCDEEKPGCLRCTRSGRVCEGYLRSTNSNSFQTSLSIEASTADIQHRDPFQPNPLRSLKTGCIENHRQHRFVQLGLELLSFDSFSRFGASAVVLDTLLPQLCFSDPAVSAAAAAVGSAYRIHTPHNAISSNDEAFTVLQYQSALHAIRRDLLLQPQGPIPLILTCFMLSIVEIFLQREENALFHLAGVSKLLQHRRKAKNSSNIEADTLHDGIRSPEDGIDAFFRTVDLQTSSFALSKLPQLSPMTIPLLLPPIMELISSHTILVQLVHACYNFTYNSYKFKYQPSSVDPSSQEQQSRLIAHLYTWLDRFDHIILPMLIEESINSSQPTIHTHALTLRMTALSALIHLSCTFSPNEIAYDAHAPHFQQIIADGDTILSIRFASPSHSADSIRGDGGQRFSAGPGIIEPLFMTAYKYRNPHYRRRAIHLLSLAGREGPWYGRREACITSRIMMLEEGKYLNDTSQQRLDCSASTSWTTEIPEEARINEMGFSSLLGNCGRRSNQVIVTYSNCSDIQKMLSHQNKHGFGQDQNLDLHAQGPDKENPYWVIWTELLKY